MSDEEERKDTSWRLFDWVMRNRVTLLFAALVFFQAATWYAVLQVRRETELLRIEYTQPCGSGWRNECQVNVVNASEIGRAVADALRK